ncbi:autophagy-related protein 23-like [Nicotiana tomentosiformis]|uniref:autophagy-related protein 23-like n=1 Tax=Nicotiana tomentosiformis TaxID=4098 RepID=UPI00388C6AB5
MAKTSKTITQEEKASLSRPAGDKTPVEPHIEECIPGLCELTFDFKVENSSSLFPGFLVQSRTLQVGFDNWFQPLCLGDNVVMRPPPLGEEEVPKPTKDKKMRRASPPDTSKPRKSRARKSKTNLAVLPADATMLHLEESFKYRVELARGEADLKKLMEERDTLKLLYVQKEEEIMSIRAELTRAHQDQTELIEQVQQKAELVEQLCEEAKMKEAETLGWKQNMDRLASEKDTVWAQLSSVKHQLQSVKEENLARAQKVEKLETRLAAELARAISEAEALVASYQADVEASNTRAKEISDAAEVRLPRVFEHARHQSWRDTLEEVHACGFDLTANIESAKVLEDEAGALLSDDEDSASGSENEGDED